MIVTFKSVEKRLRLTSKVKQWKALRAGAFAISPRAHT
jgi:hypothetical protein